jgi:DNA-binding SARP family transcriptional activator
MCGYGAHQDRARPAMTMQFRVLGGLAAVQDDDVVDLGGPKQRAVLATLLAEPGRAVPPQRMVDQVWGDEPPPSAETSLQAYISNLRRVLEPGRKPREAPRVLVTQPGGYALLVDRGDVDLTVFEDLAADGHDLLRRGDPMAAVASLDAALSQWGGPPLPELTGVPWADEVAARLGQIRAQALEDRFDAGLAAGEHDVLVPRIESAIADEPFREHLRAQLALALYRSGRQRDALASLHEARRVLVDEVGIEPGPELRRLEAEILDQSPTLDAPPAVERPAGAPLVSRRAQPSEQAQAEPSLDFDDERPFIGRGGELDLLLDAYRRAASGAGRPVVVCGEPGIGKTRLVEELTARVPDAVVAWGRCPESAAQAAFWPCIQIGRQLEGADALDGDLVAELLPDDDVQPSDDPTAERFALHLSIARILATAKRPLVLVVDDLHWADPASLRVIEFVASELRNTRTLLVVTTRPTPPGAPSALVDCLGELARQPGSARLDLAGLSEREVEHWMSGRARQPAHPAVASFVYDRTDGNPFFVGEIVELLAGEGRLGDAEVAGRGLTVPAGVQDVIRRRIGRLPAASQQLLTSASIVGRTFDVDVLAEVTGSSALEVLDGLEPGLLAGIVEETDLPGRFQFSHALMSDALASEVSPARRARLPATIAPALASLRAADLDSHLAELAHHAFEGAAAGTATQAYEWTVRSARQSATRLAFEDAAHGWELALHALDLARPGDREERFDVLFELAQVNLGVDDVAAAYRALVSAIDLALELGDHERLARAAAAANVEGLWFAGEIGLSSVDIAGALERALAALPPEPSVPRALALGALVENAYWYRPVAELDQLSAEAVEMARATGDRAALGRSLHKRNQALWRAGTFDQRAAAASELLDLVESAPAPPEIEAIARFGAGSVSWELGEVAAAESQVRRAREIAGRLNSPALITQLDFFQATIHIWFGRLHAAEALVDTTYDLYRRTRRWQADTFRAGFMVGIWMEQDRADDVVSVAPMILDSPYRPWFGEALALVLFELGRPDEASEIISGGLPPMVDSWLALGVLGASAHNRVSLGDRQAAEQLREQLGPLVGRLACVGTGTAFGDIAYALARVDDFLGDHRAARRHADLSVEVTGRAGQGPWLARSLLFRAELTGDEADRERAKTIIDHLDLTLLRQRL